MSASRLTLDANILVYAVDKDGGARHRLALDLVTRASLAACPLPLQALGEFYAVVTRKLRHDPELARIHVEAWLEAFPIIAATAGTMRAAMKAVSDHNLAFWDAMLWSVADDADCSILLTEDLQHGRRLGIVTFINPFATRKLPDIVRDVLG